MAIRSEQKIWIARTMRQAGFLTEHGCTCLGTVPDKTNPKYVVFLFDATTEGFADALEAWGKQVKAFKENNK